jgi:NADPH:quinone reductase-like Zn-dependent oxidoreductase/acyl carrier protein
MNGDWVLHSRGALELTNEAIDSQSVMPIEQIKNDGMHTTAESHYAAMSRTGIEYGPAFRLFAEAWTVNDSAQNRSLARIEASKYVDGEYQNYVIHPAVLDACLQSLMQVGPLAGNKFATDTYLPVGIERFTIHRPMVGNDEIYVLATATHIDTSQDFFALNLSILTASGDLLVSLEGLKAQRIHSAGSNDVSSLLFNISWQKSETLAPVLSSATGQHLLVFANRNEIASALKDLVTGQGAKCTLVYPSDQFREIEQGNIYEVHPRENEHLDRLFHSLISTPPSAVVHLWSTGGEAHGDLDINLISRALDHTAYHLPLLVRAITSANFDIPPRLWVITNGVMSISDRPASANIISAPLWGAGTAIAREHPELRPCVIDTVLCPSADDLHHLAAVLLSGDEREDRIALRDQKHYVPRLTHFRPETSLEKTTHLKPDEEYRVEILNPGILDNLSLRAFMPRTPGPGEVAIQIITSGLNFMDAAKAMDIYPGLDPDSPIMLGIECTGRILAVGDGVFQFAVGDDVVAMTEDTVANGLLASHTVLPQELVFRKPANLNDEEASSFLIAYLTAYHSLVRLAHIASGEWVLIHAGAGGVGLAAIKIAQQAGARVIATASSPDKHEFLKSLGVKHVLQSRSTDFARRVMDITDGRGVDIVLNSLSGEFITKSLEILAPYGRFIELGKRDIYRDRRVGLKVFRNNISYHVVDIAAAVVEQQAYIAELLRLIIEKVSTGAWPPLPVTTFQVTDTKDAFRFITQARHIGKVVITHDRDIQVLSSRQSTLFRSDASYVITGGLGGVGSAAARWMAANGAGHLVLVSRRETTPETEIFIQEVERLGVRVQHIQTDVADHRQVELLMATIRHSLPPLKGILHAAAAIDDALALDMTRERFVTAMEAKVNGTWNLHTESLEDDLDFFVLFSSVAALYPQVGVTSYAAANTFLDAFAEYRKHLGLPATSINWGGWDNTGLAREAGTARSIDSYSLQGLLNFTQAEGLECLRIAILHNLTQAAVFRLQLDEFERYHAKDGVPSIFSVLARTERGKPDTGRDEIFDKLLGAPSRAMRLDLIEEYLQQQLSHVLKLAVDRIDRERTLGTMGLDSLMALELIRRINTGLKLALPATVAFNYPSIRQLAAHILQKLALDTGNASETEPVAKVQASPFASTYVDAVSEQDALNELMMPDRAAYEQ